MKAVCLYRYDEHPVVEEVAEPKITGPHDVIVRIGVDRSREALEPAQTLGADYMVLVAAVLEAIQALETGNVRGRAILVP
jgi:hypothetical protein